MSLLGFFLLAADPEPLIAKQAGRAAGRLQAFAKSFAFHAFSEVLALIDLRQHSFVYQILNCGFSSDHHFVDHHHWQLQTEISELRRLAFLNFLAEVNCEVELELFLVSRAAVEVSHFESELVGFADIFQHSGARLLVHVDPDRGEEDFNEWTEMLLENAEMGIGAGRHSVLVAALLQTHAVETLDFKGCEVLLVSEEVGYLGEEGGEGVSRRGGGGGGLSLPHIKIFKMA